MSHCHCTEERPRRTRSLGEHWRQGLKWKVTFVRLSGQEVSLLAERRAFRGGVGLASRLDWPRECYPLDAMPSEGTQCPALQTVDHYCPISLSAPKSLRSILTPLPVKTRHGASIPGPTAERGEFLRNLLTREAQQ